MRRYLKFAAGALLLMLIGAGGGLAYLRSAAFQRRAERYVVGKIEQATGARAGIGGFQLQLWPLRVTLSNLVVHGREGAGEPPLAQIPRLAVGIRWTSLLGSQLRLNEVEMSAPRFHLYLLADGAVNLPRPAAAWARRQQEASTLFALGARRLAIADGELDLADRRIPLNLRLTGLGAQLEAVPAGYGGRLAFTTVSPVHLHSELSFTLMRNDLRLDRMVVMGRAGRLRAQGWLRHFTDPGLDATYTLDLRLPAAANLLAAFTGARKRSGSEPIGGVAQAAGNLYWSPAAWRISGAAAVSGLRTPLLGGGWKGRAQFEATPAHLNVSAFELAEGHSAIRGNARDQNWQALTVNAQLHAVPLAAVRPALMLAGLPPPAAPMLIHLQSRIDGTVMLRGRGRHHFRTDAVTAAVTLAPAAAGASATGGGSAERPAERASPAGYRSPAIERPSGAAPTKGGRATSTSAVLPLAGHIDAAYAPARQALTIRELSLNAAGEQFEVSGTVNAANIALKLSAASADWSRVRPLLAAWHAPVFAAAGGFQGRVSGRPEAPAVSGTLRLSHAAWGAYAVDALTAAGSLGPGEAHIRRLVLHQGSERLEAAGSMQLSGYRVAPTSQVHLRVRAQALNFARLVTRLGFHPSAAQGLGGTFNAQAAVDGTWGQPSARGELQLLAARWRGQAVQSLTADFDLQHGQFVSTKLEIALARTRIAGQLRLGLRDHTYQVDVSSAAVQLGEIAWLQSPRLAMRGQVRFELTGSGVWSHPQAELILTTTGLEGGGERLGDLGARFELQAGRITFHAADILANGSFNLGGAIATAAPYRARLQLQLREYDFDAWLRRFTLLRLTGHSHVSGTAALYGPLADPGALRIEAALNPLEMAVNGLNVHNQGPVRLSVENRRLRLQPAHIVAQDSDFVLSGSAGLAAGAAPALEAVSLEGSLQGKINLALIELLHPATHASGELDVSAHLAGTAAQPQFSGAVAVHRASLAERSLPIGFDDIQGRLRLAGNRVQIDNLTAHTGGGILTVTGFANRTAAGLGYDLQASGRNMRLRYQGISTTGDLQLRLTGQPAGGRAGALLSGTAQLNRVGLDRNFDLALFLARMQSPPVPPGADSVLNRVRLDVHLTTGPQVEVATNLARLQLQADLHLRGTLAQPVVLGRASASEGRILFAGNEYQLSKAQVQFVNPFRIEPLLDVGLTTTVQQYDVTLNISGPADKLSITYRSDPPLSSADVVALLATGQPTQATASLNTSNNFAGTSEQILGQALDNVMAERLHRLFGITQVQVNPNAGPLGTNGSGGTVTIRQQVARNVKLTYTQNLASSSQDIIQIDWTISRALGITLNRDQFGLYGLKFTLRQRAR